MRYTQAQIRDVLDVSVETLRHWRKVLSPLQERTGRSPTFTFGDLLALSVVQRLTDGLGMAVSHLQPAALALFTICNELDWTHLSAQFLVATRRLDKTSDGFAALQIEICEPESLVDVLAEQALAAAIALGPLIDKLRAGLMVGPEAGVTQTQLPFPPVAIGARRGERR